MKLFPIAADALFYASCCFLLVLGVLRYFGTPLPLALPAAAAAALAIGTAVFLIKQKRQNKKYLGGAEERKRAALMTHLALAPPEEIKALLLHALETNGQQAELKEGELVLNGRPAALLFRMAPASQDDVAALVRTYGSKFTLICSDLSPEADELTRSLSVPTIRTDKLYSVLKETDSIPEKLLPPVPSRKSRRERFRAVFKKSNARPFFVSGALLLLMSLFALFPVYYLAAGSALLLLSAGLRLLAPA